MFARLFQSKSATFAQSYLCAQLAKFLKLTQPEETEDLQKTLIDEGYCFGFCVCHAVMDITNKLCWWQAALNQVAHWNGTAAALEKRVKLPGALKSRRPPQLKRIFDRVLNYVVINQVESDDYAKIFELEDATQ